MIIEDGPERLISARILAENEAGRAAHMLDSGGIPMGNLTASMLGDAEQWQILKMIGVGTREVDEYVLRLFARGNHVEQWFINMVEPEYQQVDIEYRGVTGRVDAIVDSDKQKWANPVGVLPIEVKSVKNSQFPYIAGTKRRNNYEPGPKRAHKFQAATYGLALETPYFGITYIAADDYRTVTFVYQTADFKGEVDQIISKARSNMKKHIVPEFEPKEKWQAMSQYNKYPTFQFLTRDQIDEKLISEYPDSFRRLMGTTREELVEEKKGELSEEKS